MLQFISIMLQYGCLDSLGSFSQSGHLKKRGLLEKHYRHSSDPRQMAPFMLHSNTSPA